jgi:quercetin dioxygenase-like cupin family protein
MIERLPAESGRTFQGEEKVLRVLGSKKKWIAATVGVAAIGTFATVALASHTPVGFTPTTLVTANFDETVHLNSDRVKFQTKEPTDVRVQRVDISPGGRSGWHHHPGIVIVAVESGTVTVTHSDCSSETYGPGDPNGAVFTEGGDEPMQASSTTGATLYATFVAPSADPFVFRIDDHDFPGCP